MTFPVTSIYPYFARLCGFADLRQRIFGACDAIANGDGPSGEDWRLAEDQSFHFDGDLMRSSLTIPWSDPFETIPKSVNRGRWLTAYTLSELRERSRCTRFVLPICDWDRLPAAETGESHLLLTPLIRDAMTESLAARLRERVEACFPYHVLSCDRLSPLAGFDWKQTEETIDVPSIETDAPREGTTGIVAFSVDTAVEQHGPHLPLATDTIQSYAVLRRLAAEFPQITVLPPVDYGHLTWGLPFGMSIDITPELLAEYVTGIVNLVHSKRNPAAFYVVDVHGSIVHRMAIQAGLRESKAACHAFRWLHEPLVEFAGERGDQHAGGVETALIHDINPALVDGRWFPCRKDELAEGQMSVAEAAELSSDLPGFFRAVESRPLNGIVGDIRNFDRVDGRVMMDRMVEVARQDIRELLRQIGG